MADALPDADPFGLILAGFEQLQATIRRLRRFLFFFGMAVLVATSGWWTTARDLSATRRNGRVADCRQSALATRLDDFALIVSPQASDEERNAAAIRIANDRSLVVSYAACTGAGVSICKDDTVSESTGPGTCSHHGGVKSTVQPR